MRLSPRVVTRVNDTWPPRPKEEVFPEIMNTLDVAMLLRYDSRDGTTPEKGTRMVRILIRDHGLPVLGRIGGRILCRQSDVIAWLEHRGQTHEDTATCDASTGETPSAARADAA